MLHIEGKKRPKKCVLVYGCALIKLWPLINGKSSQIDADFRKSRPSTDNKAHSRIDCRVIVRRGKSGKRTAQRPWRRRPPPHY